MDGEVEPRADMAPRSPPRSQRPRKAGLSSWGCAGPTAPDSVQHAHSERASEDEDIQQEGRRVRCPRCGSPCSANTTVHTYVA